MAVQLADEIESRGALDAVEAARIGVDICGALQAVHGAGLVHRDITARNILRDESGRIVLGDFGAGTEVGDTSDPQVAGTPLYLAPSVLEGRPANASTDLYSAGVLLYYLVSGFFPVTGQSLRELQNAHRNGNRTPLRERRPDLPSDFIRIVDRLLETGPDRPALPNAWAPFSTWRSRPRAPSARSSGSTLNPAARSHDNNSPFRRAASSCYSGGSMVKALSVCAVRMAPSFSLPLASMARSGRSRPSPTYRLPVLHRADMCSHSMPDSAQMDPNEIFVSST